MSKKVSTTSFPCATAASTLMALLIAARSADEPAIAVSLSEAYSRSQCVTSPPRALTHNL